MNLCSVEHFLNSNIRIKYQTNKQRKNMRGLELLSARIPRISSQLSCSFA